MAGRWRQRKLPLPSRQAFDPDKPFFMHWTPGGVHGPHHIFAEWADKYKDKFDDGWDAYRERVYKRQLEMGIIPPGTKLTPRDPTLPAWDSVPEAQRPFQRRLMEIFAGLGSPKTDNMYHAGWAWAGDTPFKGTKLLGAYFGGTRNPMVISWPERIKPDRTTRSQFHHVVDIAPTIYEIDRRPFEFDGKIDSVTVELR